MKIKFNNVRVVSTEKRFLEIANSIKDIRFGWYVINNDIEECIMFEIYQTNGIMRWTYIISKGYEFQRIANRLTMMHFGMI